MMKNTILIAFLLVYAFSYAQFSNRNSSEGKWQVDMNFGSTKLYNTTSLNVGDNINVGLDLGVTREFANNIYASVSLTSSTIKKAGELWENPLTYFSSNFSAGYVFNDLKTDRFGHQFITPFFGVGTSFISAPNTIENSESSNSINFTVGAIIWLRDSNLGFVLKDTYKEVNNNFMVSHNRITLGLKYNLE